MEAVLRSPGYLRTTVWVGLTIACGLAPVWLVDGPPAWRAPLAVVSIGLSGALAGLLRRDAESVPAE